MPDVAHVPHHHYVPAGIVRVSDEALAIARKLDAQLRRTKVVRDPVVTFDWHMSMSLPAWSGEPAKEYGPGLGVGADERTEFPADSIQTRDGLSFAIQIPSWIWEASRERLIDVGDAPPYNLVLR